MKLTAGDEGDGSEDEGRVEGRRGKRGDVEEDLKVSISIDNILQTTFLYISVLQSFSLITVWVCNFFGKRTLLQKLLVKRC
jgi:hypothetical protein